MDYTTRTSIDIIYYFFEFFKIVFNEFKILLNKSIFINFILELFEEEFNKIFEKILYLIKLLIYQTNFIFTLILMYIKYIFLKIYYGFIYKI